MSQWRQQHQVLVPKTHPSTGGRSPELPPAVAWDRLRAGNGQLQPGQGFPRESTNGNLGMYLGRRTDSALAMHKGIHPHPSRRQMKGETTDREVLPTTSAAGIPVPFPKPLSPPCFYRPSIQKGKQRDNPLCPPIAGELHLGAWRQQGCCRRSQQEAKRAKTRP